MPIFAFQVSASPAALLAGGDPAWLDEERAILEKKFLPAPGPLPRRIPRKKGGFFRLPPRAEKLPLRLDA